ncbi:hypothetical protein [Faecalibacter macacae]|uniref:Uncharacterized protein n=1 Tax=Faecalibacter macacae TaxID=1859289 RepID=A0A3L9M835_9FLAO|nr:hypothetical protein [Faecalibacter macacae]RLZ09138.1 hypothetical protein EAH69_08990 [Faecalibacter macacae]
MKNRFLLLSFLCANFVLAQEETIPHVEDQTIKLLDLYRLEINQLKNDKESLQQTIKLHEELLNSLQKNNNYNNSTKWTTIKNNITNGVESYRHLNDKIQILKTVSKTASYVNYTNSLSGITDNPLGFSFKDKIESSYKSNFTDKKKQPKFTKIIEAITTSPLVQLVPIASQASTVTNSVLNILYTNEASAKESELANIQKFEKEISKYLKYFNEMSAQNQELSVNNATYVKGLESIQQDMVKDVVIIRENLGLKVRERNEKTENLDAYLNYLLEDLNPDFVAKYLLNLSAKHKNIEVLLQSEPSVFTINNNFENLDEYATRFKSTYDFYISFNKSYVGNLTKIVNEAKANNIIEAKDNKSVDKIHQDVIDQLSKVSNENLQSLENTIRINQLENSVNKINYIKFL